MATVQMGFRAPEETHELVSQIAKLQGRSIANVLNTMVSEQLKRVDACGYQAIFYKAGEETNEQERTG